MAHQRRLLLTALLVIWLAMVVACTGTGDHKGGGDSKPNTDAPVLLQNGKGMSKAEAKTKNEANRKEYEANVERLKAAYQKDLEQFKVEQQRYEKDLAAYRVTVAEFEATTKLELARSLQDEKAVDAAKRRFQEIIKQHPTTQAAQDAKILLNGGSVKARKPLARPKQPRPPVEPQLVLPNPPEDVLLVEQRAFHEAEQAKQRALQEERAIADAAAQKKLNGNVGRFMAYVDEANKTSGLLIVREVSVKGEKATITVADTWHAVNYQNRLQAAQRLWKQWAAIASPTDPDRAAIKLIDLNGNEVGGHSLLSGVWVQKN